MFGFKRALIGGRITVVELKMKKSDPNRGEERPKEVRWS